MHPFDRQLARRSLGLGVLFVLLATSVVVATDEPGSTLGMRLARLCALAPALAASGVAITLGQARVRGETRALEALGAPPWRVGWGALLAGWAIGAIAVALVITPAADPGALFPAVAVPTRWLPVQAGLSDLQQGIIVAPDGGLTLGLGSAARLSALGPGRAAALVCVGALGLAAPLWATAPLGVGARLAGGALALGLVVVSLHAVAAGRAPVAALLVGALPLVLQTGIAFARRSAA